MPARIDTVPPTSIVSRHLSIFSLVLRHKIRGMFSLDSIFVFQGFLAFVQAAFRALWLDQSAFWSSHTHGVPTRSAVDLKVAIT